MQETPLSSGAPVRVPQIRRTTQACDACKLRKVKCNGESRCQQCSHLNLRCVYSAPKPRVKSLKRGQLIAKYKQITTNGHSRELTRGSAQECSDSSTPTTPVLPAIATLLPDLPVSRSVYSPPQDTTFFSNFIRDYEVWVYPVNPIITISEVQSSINEMHTNSEACAFIYAFVAVTINLTGWTSEEDPSRLAAQVEYWCHESIRARGVPRMSDWASVRNIMTSEFLHICFMETRHRDMAFYYLRDAITMVQMLRIDSPNVMQALPLLERARRQRLYWESFVHERYLAIADYHTLCLPKLDHLPEFDPSLAPEISEGFPQILKLFTLIDEEFLNNWLGSRTGSTTFTSTWIEEKQKQIDAEQAGNDDQVSRLTDMQQADLVITKYWFRTLVWQMAMSKCLLSSAASKESMSLLFPVRLSKQLRSLLAKMSRLSFEYHGPGLQQKLFELTDTIANVIITVPAATVEETTGRVDDFLFLVNFFFTFARFDSLQREILQKKLETLQSLFPYSANTPDSTLPDGAIPDQEMLEDDPWLSSVRTFPGDSSIPESPMRHMQNKPLSRTWQDMTRRLSLAPSAMSHVPQPHLDEPE